MSSNAPNATSQVGRMNSHNVSNENIIPDLKLCEVPLSRKKYNIRGINKTHHELNSNFKLDSSTS